MGDTPGPWHLLFRMRFWFRADSASASHLSGQLGAEAHRTACGLLELRNQGEIETAKCCLRACESFYRRAAGMHVHWSMPFETLFSCMSSRTLDVWPFRSKNSSLVHTTNTWPMGLGELRRHADIISLCGYGYLWGARKPPRWRESAWKSWRRKLWSAPEAHLKAAVTEFPSSLLGATALLLSHTEDERKSSWPSFARRKHVTPAASITN